MKKLASADKVKRSGIRAIDQGTRYDLSGSLRKMAREIERGEHPGLRDLAIVYRSQRSPNKYPRVDLVIAGTGTISDHYHMLKSATERLDLS